LKAEIRHRGWENKERKLVKGEGEYGEEVRPMRIIVVGAGIAGISAAREVSGLEGLEGLSEAKQQQ